MKVKLSLILVSVAFSGCSTDFLESITLSKGHVQAAWPGCIELEKYLRRDWLVDLNSDHDVTTKLEGYLKMCQENVERKKNAWK